MILISAVTEKIRKADFFGRYLLNLKRKKSLLRISCHFFHIMPLVKRTHNVTMMGNCLSDIGVNAFESNLNCDVVIKSKEGEILRAHQVKKLIIILLLLTYSICIYICISFRLYWQQVAQHSKKLLCNPKSVFYPRFFSCFRVLRKIALQNYCNFFTLVKLVRMK